MYRRIATAIVAILFITAGAYKLIAPHIFAQALTGFTLIPSFIWPYLLWIIPTAELIIGMSLLIPRLSLIGRFSSVLMLSAFTALICASMVANTPPEYGCGCFPWDADAPLWTDLVRNIIMIILTVTSATITRPFVKCITGTITLGLIASVVMMAATVYYPETPIRPVACDDLRDFVLVFGDEDCPSCPVHAIDPDQEPSTPYLIAFVYKLTPPASYLKTHSQLQTINETMNPDLATMIRVNNDCDLDYDRLGVDFPTLPALIIWERGNHIATIKDLSTNIRSELTSIIGPELITY